MKIKQSDKILFIGDSITEDGRFDEPDRLGAGYVRLIHDFLYTIIPGANISIKNKGTSGNRVTDLDARWEKDVIDEQPHWLSVSIGVNDVWRQLDRPEIEQVYPQEFKQVYRKILTAVTKDTNARLIIVEPTIIEEDISSKGNYLLKEYVSITKELSREFKAVHVPMHERFIDFIKRSPKSSLTTDGVHMNSMGRMLMAITWLNTIGATIK